MSELSDLPHLYPTDVERAFVGSMLLMPANLTDAAIRLMPRDISVHELKMVYAEMVRLHAEGLQIDPATLGGTPGLPNLEWMIQLQNETYSVSGYGDYIEIILEASRRRSAMHLGAEIVHGVQAGMLSAADAVARYGEITNASELDAATGRLEHMLAIELYDKPEEEEEWLIPGVIAKGWRVILAGSPGIGKMTLLRQIAACGAAGVNPFNTEAGQEPLRTLVVDVETPETTVRQQLRLLSNSRALIDAAGPNFHQSLLRSLDLVNSPTDRMRLEQLVADVRPDILVLGPLYKICPHAPNGSYDAESMAVIGLLDRIRDRYEVAMCIEQHVVSDKSGSIMKNTSHAGSENFIRWADMAVSMVEDADSSSERMIVKMDQQRGVRGNHAWPLQMARRPPGPFHTGLCWQTMLRTNRHE